MWALCLLSFAGAEPTQGSDWRGWRPSSPAGNPCPLACPWRGMVRNQQARGSCSFTRLFIPPPHFYTLLWWLHPPKLRSPTPPLSPCQSAQISAQPCLLMWAPSPLQSFGAWTGNTAQLCMRQSRKLLCLHVRSWFMLISSFQPCKANERFDSTSGCPMTGLPQQVNANMSHEHGRVKSHNYALIRENADQSLLITHINQAIKQIIFY